jgi:exonuclease SbcD
MHDAQAQFLDWLVGQVQELGVEAVLVAGDVYDRSVPPQQSVELLDDALHRLSALCPVIVTSGNHDSPTRLNFGGPFFERGGVHLRCRLADMDRPVVLTGSDGVTVAIYGLPYLEPDHHRNELGAERSHASVLNAAMDRVRADLAGRSGLRSIAMGHAFVTGGLGSDSERDVRVGGIGDAPASVFTGVDYVALGHLHRAQHIAADDVVVRYSGSPLAYSFSEEQHTKSVTIIDIPGEGQVSVTEIPTPVPRRLATIRGTLAELLADPALEVHTDDWVRAVLTDERRPTDAMAQIRSRFPYALQLEFDRPLPERLNALVDVATADPVDVALGFVEHVTTTPASDDERAVLAAAIESVRIHQVEQ